MNKAWFALLLSALLAAANAGGAAQAAETLRFAYLYRDRDPHYVQQRTYTGIVLKDPRRPIDGARTAMRESRIIGRALGLAFALDEVALAEAEAAADAVQRLRAATGATIFLLDLPLEDVAAAGRQLAGAADVVLFNIRHRSDRLRAEDCAPALFHVIPSDAMLADALAQYLAGRKWTDVLVLRGPRPDDRELAAAFRAAAGKFSLSVRAERDFMVGNDPRLRDRTNIDLLTGGVDYDVVFLADTLGEFGRYVPFATYLPRPVVGSAGLAAAAWHWSWERHGAPQLNQRFDRQAQRRMADEDWAAWAAVRSVVEAVRRTGRIDAAAIVAAFRDESFGVDLYKGIPGSFRSWDNQLRQAILLQSGGAVTALAPIEGFLHQRNVLDSLGVDAAETRCRF